MTTKKAPASESKDPIVAALEQQTVLYIEVIKARGAAKKEAVASNAVIADAKSAYDAVVTEENAKTENQGQIVSKAETALVEFRAEVLESLSIELPDLLQTGGGQVRI